MITEAPDHYPDSEQLAHDADLAVTKCWYCHNYGHQTQLCPEVEAGTFGPSKYAPPATATPMRNGKLWSAIAWCLSWFLAAYWVVIGAKGSKQ